ncbi:MAG: aspartate aminotransferase family protein [bacterium]|nr:aspartate aminotransferase family protein [bacterium]
MKTSNAQNLLERANRYLVGGCLGSFQMPSDVTTVFHHGKGSRLYDVDGREYIDYVMGSGPLILGHAHPGVVAAVQKQAALGSTFYALNEPIIHLAERIVEASPCGERIRFCASGTEGTFSALRLARAFTNREKILKFEGGWHGAHDYAQQSTTPPQPTDGPTPVPDSAGIPRSVSQSVLVSPFNNTNAAIELIHTYATDLAAVIVEPFQRAIPPTPGFLEALRETTKAHGILLIFDEVVTGFRMAWGGAQERYGVLSDIAVYGKTISGGYPLAAICGRADVLDIADPRRKGNAPYAFVSGTTNGNPISAVAGLATLDVLEQKDTYPKLYALADRLKTGLETLGQNRGLPLVLAGDGPVLQPFFTETPIHNYADLLKADAATAREFCKAMIRRGIFFNPGNKLYLSLAHTEEDIDLTLEVAAEVLDEISRN